MRYYYHLLIILFRLILSFNAMASNEDVEKTSPFSIFSSTTSEDDPQKKTRKRESPTLLNSYPNKKPSPLKSSTQRKISYYFLKGPSSLSSEANSETDSTIQSVLMEVDEPEGLSQLSTKTLESSFQIKSETPAVLLDFDSLPFHMTGPPRYTLLMVDLIRISSTNSNLEAWEKNGEDFAYIGPRFLKAGLITDGDINFGINETDEEDTNSDIKERNKKSRWIKIHKAQTEEQGNYYIVQLLKKEERLRTLNFVESLISDIPQRTHDFTLQAGLIIFPYRDRAMVYGLHHWNMLLNPACIIQQWGLRILASKNVFNPRGIKSISATYFRTANPSSRYENKNKLVPIEDFMIEIGSESLNSMRALPHDSYKTSGVFEGRDFLGFKIGPRNPRTGTVTESLESLEKIAVHFFKISTSRDFQIHERMREFIDEKVIDFKILKALDEKLLREIKSPNNKTTVFIDDSLWREYKNHYISFGEQGNKSLFTVLERGDFISLHQSIEIWCGRSLHSQKVVISDFLFSIPIEHDDKFYRFYKGNWYDVDASRFESIKRIMRTFKLRQEDLQLPDYSFQDTERSEQTALTPGVDYKEANYNTRATTVVSTSSGWDALLLDRLFISLGKKGNINKFEFADLLLRHQNNFYIVHIKRNGSDALSHHREQVERSADFLASELKRNNGQDLLLKGVINALYQSFSLPTKKEKNQGKRLTKGNHFQSLPKEQTLLLKPLDSDEKSLRIFKKDVSQLNIDFDFFEEHKINFAIALDAFYDCVTQKISVNQVITRAESFFESVKQAVDAQKFLFPDGVLSQESLKNIKIILAVIDDRNIERHLKKIEDINKAIKLARKKGKDEESEEIKTLMVKLQKLIEAQKNIENRKKNTDPLFKNQDLWGLDRTRRAVQKYGFEFNLVIINEDDDKNGGLSWDAFGPIVKKEEQENFMMLDDKQRPSLRESEEINFPFPLLPNAFQEISQHMQSIEASSQSFGPNIVKYTHPSGEISEFSIYPTIGDGDCFFHAAFTEEGDTPQVVQQTAAAMRSDLCDAVQKGQYIDELRHLVYEHYIDLLANNLNFSDVPQVIKDIIIEKDEYTVTYNGMQKFGLLTETTPNPEDRYSVDIIKSLISHNHIKSYMERFRTVGGYETYIPFRPDITCPAEILAILGQRQVNIYTFDTQKKELKLIKTAGICGQIANVLHVENHFMKLELSKQPIL